MPPTAIVLATFTRQFVTENGLAAIGASIGRFAAAHRAATDKGDVQAAAAALREVRY
jgi:hypothetical protein